MQRYEIRVPRSADLHRAEAAVERACAAQGLRCGLKGTLAAHPGCVHWHFNQRSGPGTLEVTLWPASGRLWLAVQAGRRAEWIGPARRRIAAELRAWLRTQAAPAAGR